MQTYEINLWKDKVIVEKIVKQFENDSQVLEYIITWAQVNTYVRKKGPKRIQLTEEELEIQKTLEASITKEAIDEWGEREMLNQVRQDYWSNPDATGLEDVR